MNYEDDNTVKIWVEATVTGIRETVGKIELTDPLGRDTLNRVLTSTDEEEAKYKANNLDVSRLIDLSYCAKRLKEYVNSGEPDILDSVRLTLNR